MSDASSQPSVEQLLIALEQRKWQAFVRSGRFPADVLTEDFVSIGTVPGEVSRSRHPDQRLAGSHERPPEPRLDSFRVILLASSRDQRSAEAAIVTYRLDGDRPLHATSVWVHRDGRWLTAFYQTSVADALNAG